MVRRKRGQILRKDPKAVRVGIDPGKSGAVAALVDQNKTLWLFMLEHDDDGLVDSAGLVRFFRILKEKAASEGSYCSVTLEKLHYIPQKMGGGSIFQMARSFGALESVLSLLRLESLVKLRPCDWKKQAGLIGKDKKASVDLACLRLEELGVEKVQLYKTSSGEFFTVQRKMFQKLSEHDVAEAFLLATL